MEVKIEYKVKKTPELEMNAVDIAKSIKSKLAPLHNEIDRAKAKVTLVYNRDGSSVRTDASPELSEKINKLL